MTRRAIVQKWILYCLCALVLLAVQDLILVRIRIGGVHPFLLPALAVIPVTLERSGQSLLYALFFGLACDLLMPTGVFVCFYCLVFLAAAVIAQLLSGQVIVAGFFCSLAANAVGLLLCGLLQILLRTYQQSISTGPALMLMGKELLLSLGYALPRYGADGNFGAETEEALRAFQADAGLEADGKYGEKSHAAMMEATADGGKDSRPVQPEPPDVEKPPVSGTVVIVSEGGKVNIREGNGLTYGRITQLAPGTTCPYVATAENGWHAVVVGRRVGWVSPEYSRII